MAKIADVNQALEEAKRQRKLVWILFNAPWSEEAQSWSREVLQHPTIREVRQDFVFVEWNRDAHAELDHAAQFELQALGGRSGWPLNLFLDPQGKPILGATSLTYDALHHLLDQLKTAWRLDPDLLSARAAEQYDKACEMDLLQAPSLLPLKADERDEWLSEKMIGAVLTPLEQSLDFETGAVGQGTLFNYPSVYKCLLARPELAKWAEVALTGWAKTHMYDVLGGGFFRAAGKEVTEFVATEKLLTENAELLEAYVSFTDPARAEFLVQVASEIVRSIVDDFSLPMGFASSLSGAKDYYRITPTDCLTALPPNARQAAQMFFGIESANKVPFLQTDLPMLSSFLSIPPVDLKHTLVDAQKRLLEFRRNRESPPVRGERLRAPEAAAVRALYLASDKLPSLLGAERAEALLRPILDSWDAMDSEAAHSPRAALSTARAYLAAARAALKAGDRNRFLRDLARADAWLTPRLDANAIVIKTMFAGERMDDADHIGMSSGALRLHAVLERIQLAELEGDRKTAARLHETLRPLMALSMKACRPLGLYGASVYEAFLTYKSRLNASN